MSGEYPIVKRVFLAQPRKKIYGGAQWNARPVPNENTSADVMLFRPAMINQAHEQYELYYHVSEVDRLRAEIERLKGGRSAT